jgi:hypothetical protein
MSRLPSIGLLSGLTQVPDFSSIDFPWFPATDFLATSSGPGPQTQDKTNLVLRPTANNAGDVGEGSLRLADLSNPNLKRWVVDHYEESLAGKLRYASRASCRPAGVPMFPTYAGRFQPIYFSRLPGRLC